MTDLGSLAQRPRTLYVFGIGGQGREAAWYARARWGEDLPVRFVVDHEQYLPAEPRPDVGLVVDIDPQEGDRWVAAVGAVATRRQAVARFAATGLPGAQVVHPSVDLSGVEQLGADVVVGPGAVLSVGVVVDDHVHINVGATVSHDTHIGDFVTVAPGAHIAGWVDIRPGAFVGAGATIVNSSLGEPLVIGEDAMVAAGACVLGSVEAGAMYAGVPATRRR